MTIHAFKDPLGYAAMTALIQAGIYSAKAARTLTVAEAVEAAAGFGLIAGEVAPATAAAAAAGAGYIAYRGGKYAYDGIKDEYKWAKSLFSKKRKRNNDVNDGRAPKRPSLPPAQGGMPLVRNRFHAAPATGRGFKTRKRRTKKPDTKSVKVVYDDNGHFSADHVLYLTQQDYGSLTRAMHMGTQALLRAALSQVHVYPAGVNLTMDMPSDATHLVVYFRQIESHIIGAGGAHQNMPQVLENNRVFLINGKTFKTAAEDMVTTSTVSGNGIEHMLKNGYYPYAFKWRRDGAEQGTGKYRELGDSTITFKAKTLTRIQNVSEGDYGEDNKTTLYTNPVRGKIYYTSGPTPMVRDALLEQGLDNYDGFHRVGLTTDLDSRDAAGIHVPVVVNGAQSELNHPPNGRTLFKNCYAERNIVIGAGKILKFSTSFKKTMRVSEFFKALMTGDEELTRLHKRNTFGKCSTIALEHSIRGQRHIGGDDNSDTVTIGVNRELFLSAFIKLRTRVPMLSGYQNTHVGYDHA